MTRRAPLAPLLATVLLLTPGCGTLLAADHHQTEPFSGCQADLSVMRLSFLLVLADPLFVVGLPLLLGAGLADLPLSFVGDLCVLAVRADDAPPADEPLPPPEPPTQAAPPSPEAGRAPAQVARSSPPRLTLEAGATR